MNEQTYYCVTSAYYDNGRVTAAAYYHDTAMRPCET